MITTIAELLDKIRQKESLLLRKYDIRHPTIIGSMYEGLTKTILNQAIPNNLKLNIVSGVIVNDKGELSRQIDCMLVQGEGEQIPFTTEFKYNINNVLAVIEVKKNLYSSDLRSGYQNLFSVSEIITPRDFDEGRARLLLDAFRSITRMHLPETKEEILDLPLHIEMIYHTLVTEIVKPIRIIFGYDGFSSELKLRDAFAKYQEENLQKPGFSPGSYPNLVLCNNFSLIKLNGMPYTAPMNDDRWLFYASYYKDPLLLLLEIIWTRLSYFYGISSEIFGEDLTLDAFHAYFWGKCVKQNDLFGWMCGFIEVEESALKKPSSTVHWEPEYLDAIQFVIINELIREETIDISNEDFVEFLASNNYKVSNFVSNLVSKNLVTVKGKYLSLLTDKCMTAILPDGSLIAGEDKTGRLSRWIARFMEDWDKK